MKADEAANIGPKQLLAHWGFRTALCALAVAIGLSLAVGKWGSSSAGIDWSLAAAMGTALGTSLLAVATFLLALLTWQEVSATQQLANMTARDLLLRDAPLLVLHYEGWSGSWESGSISVSASNNGRGDAIAIEVSAKCIDSDMTVTIPPVTIPSLNWGERTTVILRTRFSEPQGNRDIQNAFVISGHCRGRDGMQYDAEIIA